MTLASNQTPWQIVLGTGPGGSVEFIGGPAGADGAQGPAGLDGATGPQGPIGPIAAPLAKYLLDSPDAGLVNGITIHRGLGPDRAPDTPSAWDDEFITPTTGYDPKWTLVNPGAGTVHGDSKGGVVFDMGDDSKWVWLSQPFLGSDAYEFVGKIAIGTEPGARNCYVGIMGSASGDVDLSGHVYWQFWGIGYNDGAAYFLSHEGFADTDVSNLSFTQAGGPQYKQQDWWYLKVSGTDRSNVSFYVSENGVAWTRIISARALPAPLDGIRLASFYHGTLPAPNFVQWFRRTV